MELLIPLRVKRIRIPTPLGIVPVHPKFLHVMSSADFINFTRRVDLWNPTNEKLDSVISTGIYLADPRHKRMIQSTGTCRTGEKGLPRGR
jgi:hypothetical protein